MDEDRRSHDRTHRRLLGSVPRPGSVGRRDLRVLGLRCPRSCRSSNVFSDSTCLACHAACRSFPLGSVADFECKGSSCRHDPARHGSFYLFAKTRGGEGERGGAKIIGYICVTRYGISCYAPLPNLSNRRKWGCVIMCFSPPPISHSSSEWIIFTPDLWSTVDRYGSAFLPRIIT